MEATIPPLTSVEDFVIGDIGPTDFPGLIAWWDFAESGLEFPDHAAATSLRSQSGPLHVVDDPQAPGGRALELQEGQWLSLSSAECPALDRHGPDGHLTLVAWIRRGRKSYRQCQFIAGRWNESGATRQYGLFLDIPVWQRRDTVFAHASRTGGPTPGYRYCMDGAQGASPIDRETWHCVAMVYDGTRVSAWLDGQCDGLPGLNPYDLPGGLNDAGQPCSDFTVGAVDREGEIGNYFVGRIGGIAVYDRALSPAELHALGR